jgi:hypothetical protein
MFPLLRMRPCPIIQSSRLISTSSQLNCISSQLHLQLRNLISQRLNLPALSLQQTSDLAQDFLQPASRARCAPGDSARRLRARLLGVRGRRCGRAVVGKLAAGSSSGRRNSRRLRGGGRSGGCGKRPFLLLLLHGRGPDADLLLLSCGDDAGGTLGGLGDLFEGA